MTVKSLLAELSEVQLAIELIEMGARLQVVESETTISRPRLVRIYKEVRGISPPKGLLPFSTDWFMTWMPNIHASLFINIYQKMLAMRGNDPQISVLIKSYRLYREQVSLDSNQFALSLTRAWTLIRFFESNMLEIASCSKCSCHFIAHAHTPSKGFVCGICNPPSRAGKTKKGRPEEKDGAEAVTAQEIKSQIKLESYKPALQ